MGGIKDAWLGGTYPHTPGSKVESGPSVDAARRMTPMASTLRGRVFDAIKRKPQTADEIAVELGATVLSVRPRVAELNKREQIEPDGDNRRANASGIKATVWRQKCVT